LTAGVCCGVLILIVRFFLGLAFQQTSGFAGFVRMAVLTQLLVIAVPALLMTFSLTRSPRQTLLLKWPPWLAIPAAAMLAVALHPASSVLQSVVTELYPISDSLRPAMQTVQEMFHSANVWTLIFVIAVVPAVCEELAFRGFILSGFRHVGHKWRAIVYSAIFFSLAHGILQQSIIACLLGVIIAYLAVQSGSLLPGIVFHAIHNSLVVVDSRLTADVFSESSILRLLASPGEGGGCVFHWPVVMFCSLLALLPLAWFALQPYAKSAEEKLQDAIAQAEKDDKSLAAVG
jgi:sodium transport system permease protein